MTAPWIRRAAAARNVMRGEAPAEALASGMIRNRVNRHPLTGFHRAGMWAAGMGVGLAATGFGWMLPFGIPGVRKAVSEDLDLLYGQKDVMNTAGNYAWNSTWYQQFGPGRSRGRRDLGATGDLVFALRGTRLGGQV